MASTGIDIFLATNGTADAEPTTIDEGEPLLNTADDRIFVGNDTNDNYATFVSKAESDLSSTLGFGNLMGGTDIDGEDNASVINLTSVDATSASFDSIADDGSGNVNVTSTLDVDADVDVQDSANFQSAVDMQSGLNMNSTSITNVADPSNAQDAVTKSWVEGQLNGLDPKEDVRVATDGTSIDLTSSTDPSPIDGVTLSDGDRVLLKDQSTASENGIYVATTATDPSTWSRSADMDEDTEVDGGEYLFATEGDVNGDRAFVVTSNDPVLGTDPIEWAQFSALGQIQAGSGLTKTGGDTINANAGDNSITMNADDFSVNVDGTSIETDGTEGVRLGSGAVGSGLTGGSGSTVDVVAGDNSLTVNTDSVEVNVDDSADGIETVGDFGDNPITVTNSGLNVSMDNQSIGLNTDNALEVQEVDGGSWS